MQLITKAGYIHEKDRLRHVREEHEKKIAIELISGNMFTTKKINHRSRSMSRPEILVIISERNKIGLIPAIQKLVQAEAAHSGIKDTLISEPRGKPFWIFDREQHKAEGIRNGGKCCFWHSLGCLQKDGRDIPVVPYMRTLYEAPYIQV